MKSLKFFKNDYDILDEYYITANKNVARILRYLSILIFAVAIATITGIFTIDKYIIFWALLALTIGALLPTLFTDVLGLNEPWTVYVILTVIECIIGILYTLLSYHTVMMFALPVIVSCLYMRESYTRYVTITTIPIVIVSHLLAFGLDVVPSDPLVSLGDVIFFGIIPRLLEFLAIAFVCVKISSSSRNLVQELIAYYNKIDRNKNMLQAMVSESDGLIGARNKREVVMAAAVSVKGVITACNGYDESGFECYSGISQSDEPHRREYYLLDSDMNEVIGDVKKRIVKKDGIHIRIKDKKVTLPYVYDNHVKRVVVNNKFVMMGFYNRGVLAGYIVVVHDIIEVTDELMNMLKILYNNVDKAFINVVLNNDIQNTQRELVCSLAEISEFRSEQTGQHIKRVGEYMKLVGEKLKLPESECEDLGMASMLHDVGKLAVPSEILEKKGKLTNEEFEVIKSHVKIGDYLLENCPGRIMKMAREMVIHHHEKWDGTGYMKIRGKKINKYARYLAVVDVFDALVSKRSYKDAWAPDDAYREIVKQKGKHFAPEAVDLFVKNYDGFLRILEKYPDERHA